MISYIMVRNDRRYRNITSPKLLFAKITLVQAYALNFTLAKNRLIRCGIYTLHERKCFFHFIFQERSYQDLTYLIYSKRHPKNNIESSNTVPVTIMISEQKRITNFLSQRIKIIENKQKKYCHC